MSNDVSSRSRVGQVVAGLVLMAAGVILLLIQLGYYFPSWLLTWPMILIILGLVIGSSSLFRNPAWVPLLAVGGVFLLNQIYPEANIYRFIWPAILMVVALWLIFGRAPKWNQAKWHEHRWSKDRWQHHYQYTPPTVEPEEFTTPNAGGQTESLNSISVFGGTRKAVFSKNFVGGEVIAFLGSAEINLSQADIQGRVNLEITQVLGSARLIVPPHWQVVTSEIIAVFGGIEDKRIAQAGAPTSDKVLVLTGTSVFGGIEIQNFG
jgi:predicted membrane protein